MPNEEQIIGLLRSFGLTGNEARAYVTLLRHHPATGYELSSRSGIPRSAVYSVLAKLETLNLINATGEKPRRFTPIPPEALVEYFGHKTERDLDQLRTQLETLELGVVPLHVWHIRGYDNVMLKAKEMIRKTGERLYLSIWRTEMLVLEKEVQQAIQRGVKVIIFSFCRLPELDARIISYNLDEARLRKAWKASLILVADNSSAIIGGAQDIPSNQAVWTNAASIIQPAINHIILDITLAGTRFGIDINPVVAPMMEGLKIDLDVLIEEAHPHDPSTALSHK